MENSADDVYNLIRHHSGYGHRHIADDTLRAFIQYEFDSGRWAGTRNIETGEVTGWISWYNLDEASLLEVKEFSMIGCFVQKIPLQTGPHCYLANVVVREGQPKNTFRLLWNMACQRNALSETISAHLFNRPHKDGKLQWRWFSKPNPHRIILQEATP